MKNEKKTRIYYFLCLRITHMTENSFRRKTFPRLPMYFEWPNRNKKNLTKSYKQKNFNNNKLLLEN